MRRHFFAIGALCSLTSLGCGDSETDVPDAGPLDGFSADGSTPDQGLDAGVDAQGAPDAEPAPRPAVTIENYPNIDGSTSTLPLARVIACELLGLGYRWEAGLGEESEAEIIPVATNEEEAELAMKVMARIVHNRTHDAYLNLIRGVADVILVANIPSTEELAAAEAANVVLEWHPVALDALVILLNRANSIGSLSAAQVRAIFRGEITDWSELGGEPGEIHPYVRPFNSGSQQLMNAIVMGGQPMPEWPPDRVITFMGGLIDKINEDPLAIGYSVYYYVTFQFPPRESYKTIAVSGVEPRASTIANRSYPFVAEVWVVSRQDLDPKTLAGQLRAWLLTADGQSVVAKSGYVPLIE